MVSISLGKCGSILMWILFVVNAVMCSSDSDICELKYTQYKTYETQMKCSIERAVLEATFMSDERSICVRESDL